MLEFLTYDGVLSAVIIPDLSNIIISFISHYVRLFDEKFISECIKTGHYLYFNKNNTTLVHYLLKDKRYNDIKDLFINSKYLRAEHFQNKDEDGRTELYWLCKNKMHETISLVKDWEPEHFQNKDEDDETELYRLCFHEMYSTIALIKDWKPKHFQNKDEDGNTELHWLCINNMHSTIALVTSNFVNGFNENKVFDNVQSTFWKPEHFQNKGEDSRTELYWLCYNKMHETIALITSNFVDGSNEDKVFDNVQSTFWKPEHFQNKNIFDNTELHWLCKYKMHSTIALVTSNFVDGDCWKPEHFQNKNIYGRTELYWLCHRGMHKTIDLTSRNFGDGEHWKLKHFLNKNIYGRTELYWLCYKEIHVTITLITSNFIDGDCWKPEHCNSNIERRYMKKYNFI